MKKLFIKACLRFLLVAVIIICVDLFLYYMEYKTFSISELWHVLKILCLTGITLIPITIYIEKYKRK